MAALFDPFCNRQCWSVRLPSPGRMLIGQALSWPAKGFSWELFHTDALGFWLQTRGTFPQKWGLTFKMWTRAPWDINLSKSRKLPSLRIEMSNLASWNDVTTQKCSHFSIVLHQHFGNSAQQRPQQIGEGLSVDRNSWLALKHKARWLTPDTVLFAHSAYIDLKHPCIKTIFHTAENSERS